MGSYQEFRNKENERRKRVEPFVDFIEKIIIFPGSKDEYEEFVGYETEFVDNHEKEKGIYLDPCPTCSGLDLNKARWLKKERVEALVRATLRFLERKYYYGIPVRKKQDCWHGFGF